MHEECNKKTDPFLNEKMMMEKVELEIVFYVNSKEQTSSTDSSSSPDTTDEYIWTMIDLSMWYKRQR